MPKRASRVTQAMPWVTKHCRGPTLDSFDGNLLVFNDLYYGDWTVYCVKPEDCERPTDTFRQTTRKNDLLAHRKLVL